MRQFWMNSLLYDDDAETGLQGGSDLNPILLLLPRLGSKEFVPKGHILLGAFYPDDRVPTVPSYPIFVQRQQRFNRTQKGHQFLLLSFSTSDKENEFSAETPSSLPNCRRYYACVPAPNST